MMRGKYGEIYIDIPWYHKPFMIPANFTNSKKDMEEYVRNAFGYDKKKVFYLLKRIYNGAKSRRKVIRQNLDALEEEILGIIKQQIKKAQEDGDKYIFIHKKWLLSKLRNRGHNPSIFDIIKVLYRIHQANKDIMEQISKKTYRINVEKVEA